MAEEEFKEMELWEHLAELRTRIVRCLVYIAVGAVAAWIFRAWIWDFLWSPLRPILTEYGTDGGKIITTNITEMFTVNLQIALVSGLIFAVPFITYEAWGFIAPGLTRAERKGFYFVGPLAVVFFVMGLVTSYLVLPAAFRWFAQFLTPSSGPDVVLLPKAQEYILFLIKMCLAFGLVFELPVLLMFLAWIGLVNSTTLRSGWRYAIVGCTVIAAVATPSADAVTMMMMAAPLMVLYLASISLVKIVERIRHARDRREWEKPAERTAPPALPDAQ